MQKTTEEEKASSSLKAFGFPIEDFGNDGGGVIPEWFITIKGGAPL